MSVVIHAVRNKWLTFFGMMLAGVGIAGVFQGRISKSAVQHSVGSPGLLQKSQNSSAADFNRDGKTSRQEWRQYWSLRDN
jgi:hypothetical protein